MKRLLLALPAILLLASTASAEAQTAQTAPRAQSPKMLADARVKLDPPEGWKLEEKGTVITMLGPGEEASFILQVADAPNQEAMLKAVQNADAFLAKFATDVRWAGRPQEKVSNGLKTLVNNARAKVGGKEAVVALVVFKTPVDKVLTFIGVIDASKEKVYGPVLSRFLESVKPI